MSYIRILWVYTQMLYRLYRFDRSLNRQLLKTFKNVLNQHGRYMNTVAQKRIRLHSIQSCFICSWIGTLRGDVLSADEQQAAAYYGALMSLFDDLSDKYELDSQAILKKMKTPRSANAPNEEVLAAYVYAHLLKRTTPYALEYAKYVLAIHDQGLKSQNQDVISFEELKQMTYDKGATATLMYRYFLSPLPSTEEHEAIALLGYILQLSDDLFDIYEDREEGQHTMVTHTHNIHLVREEYLDGIEAIMCSFAALPYPKKQLRSCLLQISLITSRCLVCLDQLEQCQKRTSGVFVLDSYSRKELICDMEKPANLWQSIRYSVMYRRQLERILHEC